MGMEKTTRLRGCLLVKKWLYNYVVCNCDLRQLLDPRLCFCFFATNRCLSFGVFWRVRVCSDVLACSGVFWCSGIPVFLSYCVPVFLILVHAEGCKPHHRCLQSIINQIKPGLKLNSSFSTISSSSDSPYLYQNAFYPILKPIKPDTFWLSISSYNLWSRYIYDTMHSTPITNQTRTKYNFTSLHGKTASGPTNISCTKFTKSQMHSVCRLQRSMLKYFLIIFHIETWVIT